MQPLTHEIDGVLHVSAAALLLMAANSAFTNIPGGN
jgi:hypothetical protein